MADESWAPFNKKTMRKKTALIYKMALPWFLVCLACIYTSCWIHLFLSFICFFCCFVVVAAVAVVVCLAIWPVMIEILLCPNSLVLENLCTVWRTNGDTSASTTTAATASKLNWSILYDREYNIVYIALVIPHNYTCIACQRSLKDCNRSVSVLNRPNLQRQYKSKSSFFDFN